MVPTIYKVNGFNLGKWVRMQRSNKSISPKRRQKLDDLGFVWHVLEYQWNQSYKYLEQYVKDNGNTLVTSRYKIDGFNLGYWVDRQRGDESISPEHKQKLDDLGFVWSTKKGLI